MYDFKVMNRSEFQRRDTRARAERNDPPFALARFIEADHNDPQEWIVAPHTIGLVENNTSVYILESFSYLNTS